LSRFCSSSEARSIHIYTMRTTSRFHRGSLWCAAIVLPIIGVVSIGDGVKTSHAAMRTSQGASEGLVKTELYDLFRSRTFTAEMALPDDPLEEQYEPITFSSESGTETVKPTKRMQSLQPRVGRCYVSDPNLLPAVRLWRERQPDFALQLLSNISGSNESVTSAMHLAIDIAQLHDMYDVVFENVQKILKSNPKDAHALFVRALYAAAEAQTHNPKLSKFKGETAEWEALKDASPYFASVLGRIASDAELAWAEPSPFPAIPVANLTLSTHPGNLVIAVFGWGPVQGDEKDGWKALPPMQQRIDAAQKLAASFPDASIIASGGAVSSSKVEGVFIREELIKKDSALDARIVVDPDARDSEGNAEFIGEWVRTNVVGQVTLLIVGSDWQDPRFRGIMDGVFETSGIKATIVPVGAGSDFNKGGEEPDDLDLQKRIEVEKVAMYRDMARARGYYDQCDFQTEKHPGDNATTEASDNSATVARAFSFWCQIPTIMVAFSLIAC